MQTDEMQVWWDSSHEYGGNAPYIEALYERYLVDPNDIDESWRTVFDKLPRVEGNTAPEVPHHQITEQFANIEKQRSRAAFATQGTVSTEYERKQVSVIELIEAYRQRGHQKASLDPLQLDPRPPVPDLELSNAGLTGADMDVVFQTGNLNIGKVESTLNDIINSLESTYCGNVDKKNRQRLLC